jgi:hypothetical protein
MALESARDVNGFWSRIKRVFNSGRCEELKEIAPKQSRIAKKGYSSCEAIIIGLYN